MVKRGEQPPPAGKRNPTLGAVISRWETLLLSCHDCNRAGKHDPREFVAFHRLPLKLTIWRLAQRLKCSSCGSTNVELEAIPPNQYSHAYRMARKHFER
jgi:hypothetical protein